MGNVVVVVVVNALKFGSALIFLNSQNARRLADNPSPPVDNI